MRVLIADDERIFLKLLGSLLAKCGLEPLPVSDGQAAWTALSGPTPPPLAVLDWEMPGMNGVEVVQRLRATPGLKRTACILLTAHTEPAEIAQALAAGVDDYVRKPMHHEEMRTRIRIWQRLIQAESRSVPAHPSEVDFTPTPQRAVAPAIGGLVQWWTAYGVEARARLSGISAGELERLIGDLSGEPNERRVSAGG